MVIEGTRRELLKDKEGEELAKELEELILGGFCFSLTDVRDALSSGYGFTLP